MKSFNATERNTDDYFNKYTSIDIQAIFPLCLFKQKWNSVIVFCIVVKGHRLCCKNDSFDTNIASTFYIWLGAKENNIKSQDVIISWQWDVITSKLPQLVNVDRCKILSC